MHKIVQTKFGFLRGLVQKNVIGGGKYFAFKGIPYAEPPVGKLRFQDPVPWTKKWTGVRDAFEHGSVCAQLDKITNSVIGSDDCLYLNVYTEVLENSIPRPVMVWIHGGAFLFGSGNDDLYGPDYLVKKDIVLVTINYRLDVLGFLNLNIETAPGNQGLKDQVTALRWVKENISNFGGDPENVTVFGESAGGASVHYLTQSPLAEGLFHKAIAQSGVASNAWAHMNSDPTRYAFKLATSLGKESSDPHEVVEFLKTIDPHKLVEAQSKIITKVERFRLQFTTGPSKDVKSKTPFMPHSVSPENLKPIKIPFLLGYNSREGLLFLAGMQERLFKEYDIRFGDLIHLNFIEWLEKNNFTTQDLRELYFGNKEITSECAVEYADMIGDVLFVSGLHDVAKIQIMRNGSPTFLYKFTHDTGKSFMKTIMNIDKPGACHFDEIPYLFHIKAQKMLGIPTPETDVVERNLMESVTKMWTDFAKTGNPTPSISDSVPVIWEPINDKRNFRYLNIQENLKLETMPNYAEMFASRIKLKNKL